jgi:[glutamine synthetase] adenylyltransferase / [glutamine synthetase]-adenylyl-L-tyrosine phosphorylase
MAAEPIFADPEAAARAKTRLESLTGWGLNPFFESAFEDCPGPDLALINLERWLRASSNPATQMSLLMQTPRLARLVALILGSSQPLADALIQNPEMAGLITDPALLAVEPRREEILAEGRKLLAATSGYTHALDRIRFLQQTWTLRIVVNDLAQAWAPETVWRAVSELGDALLELTLEVAWAEYAAQKALHGPCPLMVVGFGKLGGSELNYSSDIDLVYVMPDEPPDGMERHLARFSEALGRALSDRMGRGALYRVDLRLRPFGSTGPVVQTMRAVAASYRSHAEAWESQALVRSRPIVGPPDLVARWAAMREGICFRPKLSTATLEPMISMRERVEAHADFEDLKRGPGGIRDVEFLTQALQMVHGFDLPAVRVPNTLEAIEALREASILSREDAEALSDGYRFLRQLEHRCQLVESKQVHWLPAAPAERERIARLMGFARRSELEEEVDAWRSQLRTIYRRLVMPVPDPVTPREWLQRELGELAEDGLKWFDALPESEEFYRILKENEGSLRRVRAVLLRAPALLKHLQERVAHTEALLSGEIEEPAIAGSRLDALPPDEPLDRVASTIRSEWLSVAVRAALLPEEESGPELTRVYEAGLRHVGRRLYVEFDAVALGSFGSEEMSLSSDLDLMFLVREGSLQPRAEEEAQQLLSILQRLRRQEGPIELDLRLRPEGRQGLLVRTYEGFRAYELEGMEMWERMALLQGRSVLGDEEAERMVQKAALALPLTPERLDELLDMKHRIETERVKPQHVRRHVKLGWGGLSDIEWYVGLHELRYPTATGAGRPKRMPDRIRGLARANLIHALELEALLDGRKWLLQTRESLFLLGMTQDVLPENPDKLDRLALASKFEDGNTFLERHERTIDAVRSIYKEGVDRLKSKP